MSQQIIDIASPDNGLGDKLRNGFNKTNQNFTELYNGKVDKITGKGLSKNDFTDADKSKLDGIETNAQVNVNSDFGENDPSAAGYILNRPPSLYASTGYYDYNDLGTTSTPLTLVSGVPKRLTNDTLGAFTNVGEAPYGVANIWIQSASQFDFSALSVGDTLDMRVDCLLTTAGTNKTYKILLKLGIGTPAEFTTLVGSGELKTAVTDENIVKEISFYIGSEDVRDAPAELYILVDASGSVKVNGWYVRVLRKNLNLVGIAGDVLKQDKLTATNFGTFSNSLTTEDTIPDAGVFNYTNILGLQVKTTWANIKAKLASVFQEIEKLVTNATVTGTYNVDWSNDVWDLTLTGNTTLTQSNLPASGKTKTITLNISGNFTLTYPAGWTSKITNSYSGTAALNTITVQYYGVGKYKVLIVQPS
jgi:hypothetical protein